MTGVDLGGDVILNLFQDLGVSGETSFPRPLPLAPSPLYAHFPLDNHLQNTYNLHKRDTPRF